MDGTAILAWMRTSEVLGEIWGATSNLLKELTIYKIIDAVSMRRHVRKKND